MLPVLTGLKGLICTEGFPATGQLMLMYLHYFTTRMQSLLPEVEKIQ